MIKKNNFTIIEYELSYEIDQILHYIMYVHFKQVYIILTIICIS